MCYEKERYGALFETLWEGFDVGAPFTGARAGASPVPLHVDLDSGMTAPVFLAAALAGAHIVGTARICALPRSAITFFTPFNQWLGFDDRLLFVGMGFHFGGFTLPLKHRFWPDGPVCGINTVNHGYANLSVYRAVN